MVDTLNVRMHHCAYLCILIKFQVQRQIIMQIFEKKLFVCICKLSHVRKYAYVSKLCIKMVKICSIVQWLVIQVTGCLTDGLNNKLVASYYGASE